MPNFWGNMTGTQAVEMGINIFNMSQHQAAQQRAEQQQQEQQSQENFFRKMQLDLQKQKLDLDTARQNMALEFDEKRMKREETTAKQEQAKQQKLAEYSQGMSEMIETLDFSNPEDMKKLYAFQTKYQPYGIKPSYIKPEKPKALAAEKPISQKEYGNLVFRVWDKLRDFLKGQAKPGFLGFGKVEPALPTMEDAKKLADMMIERGDTPETIDFNALLQPQSQPQMQPQIQPQPQQQAPSAFMAPQSPYARAGELFGMFSPAKRKYNALPPNEKRIVDRYMSDSGAPLSETLQMLEEAKAMKAR